MKTIRSGCGRPNMRPIVLTCLLPLFVVLPFLSLAQGAGPKVFGGVVTEEYDEQSDQQEQTLNAQATMDSLFGGGKKMAVPPQIAGGTIALPSFDSKELTVEEGILEEAAEQKAGS